MDFLMPVVYILLGIGLLGFGIILFYAFLPLFYAILGFGVGVAISQSLGLDQLATLIVAVLAGLIFFLLTRTLESLRRLLIGASLGFVVGAALANTLGATQPVTLIAAIAGAVIGALIVAAIFDPLIIVATSISGANFILAGIVGLTQNVTFDTTQIATGQFGPLLIWILLVVVGIFWQSSYKRRRRLRL